MNTGTIYMVKSHAREMIKGGPAGDGNLCYKKIQCKFSLKSECIQGHYEDEINKIQNTKHSMVKGTSFFNNNVQGKKREGIGTIG